MKNSRARDRLIDNRGRSSFPFRTLVSSFGVAVSFGVDVPRQPDSRPFMEGRRTDHGRWDPIAIGADAALWGDSTGVKLPSVNCFACLSKLVFSPCDKNKPLHA